MMDNVVALYPQTPTSSQRTYLAYGLGMATKVEQQVSIYREGRNFFEYECSSLEQVFHPNDDQEAVAFIYNNCIFEISGRNLTELPRLLRFFQLRFVERFDPKFHLVPAEDAPYIELIRWKSILNVEGKRILPAFQDDALLVVTE